jgi:hypothetical protein
VLLKHEDQVLILILLGKERWENSTMCDPTLAADSA